MQKLAARIMLAHFANANENDPISELRITDTLSGSRIATIPLNPEQLFDLLRGGREAEVTAEWRIQKLGWTHENKTEDVKLNMEKVTADYIKGTSRLTVTATHYLDIALAKYEVEGWKGNREEALNHHRRTKQGCQMTFHRWLPPQPDA